MTLFDLPPELLCQILEFNQVKDLGTLTATSPYLEPYVVHECKRRLKCLTREQTQIQPKRLKIAQTYTHEKNILRDLLDQGHMTSLEYRINRHTLHDTRDRDTAITDVDEYEIKEDSGKLKRIRLTAVKSFNKFQKKLQRLGLVDTPKKRKTKRGHGWTRKKQHRTIATEVVPNTL